MQVKKDYLSNANEAIERLGRRSVPNHVHCQVFEVYLFMAGIVEEILRDSLDSSKPLSDLLRKALVVASKLNQKQPLEWVNSELNGYKGDVPDYRILHGQAKFHIPIRNGWYPFLIIDPNFQETIAGRHMQHPVRELEHLVETKGGILIPLSDQQSERLCSMAGSSTFQVGVVVPKNGVVRILDTVRTKVLDWALSLQAAGIEGEGLSFSAKEKAVASNPSVNYHIDHIGTFSGNLGGSVCGDVIVTSTQQPGAELDKVANLVRHIRGFDGQLGLTPSSARKMDAHVTALDEELKKPFPESGKIAGLLKSVKAISENVVGSVINAGITALISNIKL